MFVCVSPGIASHNSVISVASTVLSFLLRTYYVSACGYVYMSVCVLRGQAVKSPGAGVIDHCKPPDMGARNSGPLEEQQIPLTVSPYANCLPFIIITPLWETSEKASSVNPHLLLIIQLAIGKFPILVIEAQSWF